MLSAEMWGADGTVLARTTYTYDDNGNLVTEERDSDADGTVNKRITYTYDSNGNVRAAVGRIGDTVGLAVDQATGLFQQLGVLFRLAAGKRGIGEHARSLAIRPCR